MAADSVAGLELIVVQGEVEWHGGLVTRIPLHRGRVTCGRRHDNDLVLVDLTVSRHQLDLEVTEADQVRVHLPESAAPVLVGGFKITSGHVLTPGECLQAGEIMLRLARAQPRTSTGATMDISSRHRATYARIDRQTHERALADGSGRFLQVLTKIGESLCEIDDPRAIRRNLLALVRQHLPVSRAVLALCDSDGQGLELDCIDVGANGPIGAEAIGASAGDLAHFELSSGLMKHVLDAYCVCAVEEVSELALGQSVTDAGIRSAMGASLREEGRLRGVLYADNVERSVTFSPEDRAFFSVLAGLMAVSFSTSRRLHEIAAGALAIREDPGSRDLMLGSSPAMCTVAEHARRFARLRSPVLIQGERGTGKTLAARYIHRLSSRSDGPFIHVNCASIPSGLAEAELFGIGKDAGVAGVGREGRPGYLQRADGGTLFLDEIADLPPEVQPKLLVALREGTFVPVGCADPVHSDLRLIAASNRSLDAKDSTFRADLFDRISVLRLEIPPLSVRTDDIPALARYLLARTLADEGIERTVTFTDDALASIMSRQWPGNVAELENAIRHAIAFVDGDQVEVRHLPPVRRDTTRFTGIASEINALGLSTVELCTLTEAERKHIANVLARLQWNKRQAAQVLDIARGTLDRKIEALGLTPPPDTPLRGSQR